LLALLISKKMKIIISFIVTVCLIISCRSESGESNTVKTMEEEQIQKAVKEKEKLKVIEELTSKYKITNKIDTVRFQYSIDYESILKNDYILIDKYYINDIFQRDIALIISQYM